VRKTRPWGRHRATESLSDRWRGQR